MRIQIALQCPIMKLDKYMMGVAIWRRFSTHSNFSFWWVEYPTYLTWLSRLYTAVWTSSGWRWMVNFEIFLSNEMNSTTSICTELQQWPMQGLTRNVRWTRGRIWALLSLGYLQKITCKNMLGGTCLDNSCVPCSIEIIKKSPQCRGLWERISDCRTVSIVFHNLVVNMLDWLLQPLSIENWHASAGEVVQLTPTTSKSLSSNAAILKAPNQNWPLPMVSV